MKTFWLLCLCFLPGLIVSQASNRLDTHGRKTGRWITYADSAHTIRLFERRFRKDKPVGKSYFYTNRGILDRTEQNRFRKLKTVFYYPNDMLRTSGNARLENLPDRIHYYYYGRWKAYNDSGRLVKYYYYEKGQLVKTQYLDKHKRINDSLMAALMNIDKEFTAHNTALTDSINAHLKELLPYKAFKKELTFKDSLSFAQIDRLLDVYGYPGKAIAGDASVVPFYILGFAPLSIKEKHLPKLVAAATRDELSMKSLAFFIDKLKLAKGEKQIYGTQYYLKNEAYIRYPVEDEAHLPERRSSMGLEND